METPIYCMTCKTKIGIREDAVALNQPQVVLLCPQCGPCVIYTSSPVKSPPDEAPTP